MNIYREPWMRWYDLPVLKRFALARWSFFRKHWHRDAKRLARLRSLYWVLLRGHETEICAVCGGPVHVVFWVPDKLWEDFSGFEHAARSPGGEAGAGVLCVVCFSDLYRSATPRGEFLRWTCSTVDPVSA